MCSRFELNASAAELRRRFNLPEPPALPNRAEIRPTDSALILDGFGARLARWGLKVDWEARPLINARAETLDSKPTFRRLLGRRALVPATGWWEWRTGEAGKLKHRLSLAGGGLLAFAALVDGDDFVIVTCAAAPELAEVHARMPVILPQALEAAWIDPAVPFADLAPALAPSAAPFTVVADEPPLPPQGSLF